MAKRSAASVRDKPGDLLIRGLAPRTMARLRVAAALHQQSMSDFVKASIEARLDDLEKHGARLEMPDSAQRSAR